MDELLRYKMREIARLAYELSHEFNVYVSVCGFPDSDFAETTVHVDGEFKAATYKHNNITRQQYLMKLIVDGDMSEQHAIDIMDRENYSNKQREQVLKLFKECE